MIGGVDLPDSVLPLTSATTRLTMDWSFTTGASVEASPITPLASSKPWPRRSTRSTYKSF